MRRAVSLWAAVPPPCQYGGPHGTCTAHPYALPVPGGLWCQHGRSMALRAAQVYAQLAAAGVPCGHGWLGRHLYGRHVRQLAAAAASIRAAAGP